jgi:hypothetical protein
MTRDWKPGDVAMVRLDPRTEIRVFWNGQHWQGVKGVFYDLHVSARPLVVIDPDDAEAVERLCASFLMGDEGTSIGNVTDLQAALREFANPTPPKPAEPTELGAVVEDASQVEFVHLGSGLWVYGTTDGPSRGFAYADIAAVRVLSMGVTA